MKRIHDHPWLNWLVLLVGVCLQLQAVDVEQVPPYEFSLGGLTVEQVAALKDVPGVLSVETKTQRTVVHWRNWQPEVAWDSREKWIGGAATDFYDFLVLKARLGKTRWTHGGPAGGRSDAIFMNDRASCNFVFDFDDLTTGYNEVMKLHGCSEAEPGQIRHEMLRNVVGTDVTLEKCGSGYVVVSRASRGTFVVWQINAQMFVRIDNSYDPVMVGAYVDRLGSSLPADFKVDATAWIRDEIRWRIHRLDALLARRVQEKGRDSYLYGELAHAQIFADIPVKIGRDLALNSSPLEEWRHLEVVRHWLWANREIFVYDDGFRGFKLQGPDRYDPAHPVAMPEDLQSPPAPADRRTAVDIPARFEGGPAEQIQMQAWLDMLGGADATSRALAEAQVQDYVRQNSDHRWGLGRRLTTELPRVNLEAKTRITRILADWSEIADLRAEFGLNCALELYLRKGDSDLQIAGNHVAFLLVTDEAMFQFYRPLLQISWLLDAKLPVLDFDNALLFSVRNVAGDWCFKKMPLQRDLTAGVSRLELSLVRDPSSYTIPATPAGCVNSYAFHMTTADLPFELWQEQGGKKTLLLKLAATEVRWEDLDALLAERNLLAWRKLAESCDETTPAAQRRKLLQAGCAVDPFLPYVMFRHMAAKHPAVFKEDDRYWREHRPKGDVVGTLFLAAQLAARKQIRHVELARGDVAPEQAVADMDADEKELAERIEIKPEPARPQ